MSTSLSTYYQRDWSTAIPQDWTNVGAHIARLAFPFIGLYYQGAGHIISNASNAFNYFSVAIRMSQERADVSDAWVIFKSTAEFVGNAAEVKTGLLVHTGMSLTENLYSLRNFQILSWSELGEKMLPIVSKGLYLATLYNFSKKVSYAVMAASLLFEACFSAYKAQQSGRAIKKAQDDIKILDAAAHAALAVIFFIKARTCYQEFRKIEQVVARFRGPSMVKVDPIVAPAQPTVKTSSTEVPTATNSKSEEPMTLPLNSEPSPAFNSKDQVKHPRVKREVNESSSEDSADLAKRWEMLDRNLDKIAN